MDEKRLDIIENELGKWDELMSVIKARSRKQRQEKQCCNFCERFAEIGQRLNTLEKAYTAVSHDLEALRGLISAKNSENEAVKR